MATDFNALVDSMAPKAPPVPDTAQGLELSGGDSQPPSPQTPTPQGGDPVPEAAPVAQPETPPSSGNKFTDIVDSVANDRLTQAQAATAAMQGTDADKTAKAIELGKQFNLPAAAVLPNLGEYAARSQMLKNNQVMQDNPSIADWVANNPAEANAAQDHFNELPIIQKTAVTLAEANLPMMQNDLFRDISTRDIKSHLGMDVTQQDSDIAKLRGNIDAYGYYQPTGIYGQASWWINQGSGLFNNIVHSLSSVAGGAGVGAIAGLPEGGIGAVPGAIGGAAAGLKVGLAADWAQVAHGQAIDTLSNYRDKNGQPMSDTGIQTGAAMVAALTGGIGLIGAPAQGKVVSDAVNVFTKEALTEALKKPVVSSAIENIAKNTAIGSAQGVAIMGGMTLATQIGQEIGKQISPGDWNTVINDPKLRAEYVKQLGQSMEDGAYMIGALHGIGGALGEYGNFKQSQASVQTFHTLMDQSADSKIRQRSPDAFQSFMQSQIGDTGAQNVYVPASKIQEMYHTSGVAPGASDGLFGKAVPDIDEQLKQSAPINGDIVIPTANYAAHIAGTPMDGQLRDVIRMSPDGMNMAEQKEFEQKYQDIISQMGDHLKKQQDENAPQRQIFDDMQGKAESAGFTQSQAAQYAAITSARYMTRGERLGLDPVDLYRQQGIEVRRGQEGESPDQALSEFPSSEAGNSPTLDDMDKIHRDRIVGANAPIADVIEQLQSGKAPADKKQLTLTQWLKKQGGIKDEAGEMKGLDANKQVKGLVTKNGMSHDEATQRAHEAGFIGQVGGERPTIQELRTAIADDLRNKNVVSQHEPTLDLGISGQADHLAKILNEHSIEYKDRDPHEILQDMEDNGIIGGREFNQSATPKSIDTPAFKQWFGKSKVVNDSGAPKVMYHGTTHDIKEFSHEFTGGGHDALGSGFYFTSDPKDASGYTENDGSDRSHGENPNVLPVYLSIENPLNASEKGDVTASQIREFINKAPKKDEGLENWHEDPKQAMKDASIAYSIDDENVMRGLFKVANDFYGDDVKSFNQAVKDILGYDGVVRGHPDGVQHYVAFFPEQIKSINNAGEFNKETPDILHQDARAKVTMSEGQHIISLFQKNDKTSILHEMGHIWLGELQTDAMREDAPEQLKKDWQTIKDYIGHDVGRIKTDAHETFARSIEQYLMEGKAPSNALAGAFRRFKQWFTNIYRVVQNLHVPLNDDVRAVFDRMLATDDEISQMEQRQSANQLFHTKEDGGMTDAEFKAYNDKAFNSQQAAREQLLEEALTDIRKKNTAEWNKTEKGIRPDVTEAIHNRQDIRALDWFKSGKLRDEAGNEREVPAMEIQRAALPDGAEKDLPKGVVVSAEGEHPDDIAPLLGYDNGDDMINDLRGLGKIEQSIGRKNLEKFITDQEVNAQLQKHFGVSDDELRQKAEAMVDNASRLDLKLAELRALVRKDGQSVTFTKENVGKWADTQISGMKATDGANVFQFVRAAAKAGREAIKAVDGGKDAEAIQALQKQALNMALADRARLVEKDYNSGMKLMKRVAGEQTIKSTEQSYVNQVHALLQQLGMKVNRDARELQNSLGGKALSDFVMDKIGIGRDITVADDMMSNPPALAKLTVEQFRDLSDMIKSLMHNGRDEQSLIVDGRRVEKDRVITEILQNISTFKQKDKSEFLNPADAGFLSRNLNRFTSMIRAADAELLKPEQFLDWLDKRDVLGPLNTHVFRPLKDAQIMENDLLAEQSKAFHDMDQGAEWHKSLTDEIANTSLIDPDTKRPARMSRKTMLTIALNVGNESNLKRLTEGYNWSAADVHNFLQKNMTKADWDFTQYAWDSFEKLWPKIEEMQRRTSGVAPPKIEATPITTPHGEYRGGYYPLVYDPNKTQKGGAHSDAIFDNDYYRPTTAKGHTIARVQDYSDRILLNLDVLPWKLRQAIHDLSFREAIVNADKVLSDQRFTEALKNTWGPEYGKEFRPWLRDIANSPNADNRPMSFIDNALRYSRMTMVEMGIGFRLTTMLKHGSTALSNSVGELGPDAMRRGIQEYYSDRDAKKEMVFEKSGELRHRMNQYDRDIRENMASLMGEDSTIHNMRRFGHYGVAFFDLESAIPTWIGAYRKELANGVEEKDAIYSADKIVRNAHGAQGQIDLAGVQRGPEYKKLFTMFYGFFNHMYNRERDIGHRVANDEHVDMSMVLARTLTYIAIPAIVEQAVTGHSNKDEGWGHWAARAIISQMASTLPFIRDLAGYLESGRAQETPMSRSIRAIGDQVKDIKNVATGQPVSGKWLKHAIETPGYVVGAPTGQAATSAQFLWDVNNGKEDPKAITDWVHGIMYGTAKAK